MALDASVLIGHLDAEDAHHERAGELILDAVGGGLCLSPITLAEALVAPTRAGTRDRVLAGLAPLGIFLSPLRLDAPERLADLRAQTRLRMPDCCVLLAAEQEGAELATFDKTLAAAARARGIAVWS